MTARPEIDTVMGWLLVIALSERHDGRRRRRTVDCICQCGRMVTVSEDHLLGGRVSSCGCARRETTRQRGKAQKRHGHRNSRTYSSWTAMKNRCLCPTNDNYPLYGGRGITVCEAWLTFEGFLADMGERPAGTTLDRIDGNRGYEPGNCRWATPKGQGFTRRSALHLTHDGVTDTMRGWARRLGISQPGLAYRLKRMPLAAALSYRKEH